MVVVMVSNDGYVIRWYVRCCFSMLIIPSTRGEGSPIVVLTIAVLLLLTAAAGCWLLWREGLVEKLRDAATSLGRLLRSGR